ncbi:hypothetical protein ABB55_27740 [Prosthecomicrobium hirschii]|uniref:ribonucleoside-diphosphate reductase n=1 Tax=Prosthecodimorpha hirschii TaxID=665126 RepID=A0A0P6VW58_9HYPH|nr:hypothetical protein [Prosthecomicrobium hirschii]KPL55559.1 hypothetical protein ABB55_27740 [Prosthecomicrobium hirschii]
MSRERLPNCRPCETIDVVHGGIVYTAGIGRYDDGRIAEVFLNAAKSGTAVQAIAHDSAVLISFALQYGAPVEAMRAALARDADGAATGPVGALLDLLAEGDR